MTYLQYSRDIEVLLKKLKIPSVQSDPETMAKAISVDMLEYVINEAHDMGPLTDWAPEWLEACQKEAAFRLEKIILG